MIFDWHDFWPGQTGYDYLYDLKALRPDFKATLFASPGRGDARFWEAVPKWLELAVHGDTHPDPHECEHWTRERTLFLLDDPVVRKYFVKGWCSPGWLTSDGVYEALVERGFWIADQAYNNDRRPDGLSVHLLGTEGSWHGHIQNVCGNGLGETWDEVRDLVIHAESFEFMSEAVGFPLVC